MKRMSKKARWVVLGAIIALIIGSASAVYAATNSDSNQNPKEEMMESAVKKGVLSQEQANNLKNYAQEFRTEKRKEMMEERLKTAIDNNTITQDEAQQIRNWHDSRPEAMKKLMKAEKEKMGKGLGMHGANFMD